MKVNFFSQDYRVEPEKTDKVLGICDPEGEACAYTPTEHGGDRWCATVHNPDEKRLLFIPIDKNIDIRRDNGEQESSCDGLIFAPATRELSFVELKAYHVGGYIAAAVPQLWTTLSYFLANHHYEDYSNRRAYACNPVHPCFAVSARQQSSEFRKATHFRLMPQATIDFSNK